MLEINHYPMLSRAASRTARRCAGSLRHMSSNMYPPANAARGATADLCDVFYPDPVDVVVQPTVQIAEPVFRCARRPPPLGFAAALTHGPSVLQELRRQHAVQWAGRHRQML